MKTFLLILVSSFFLLSSRRIREISVIIAETTNMLNHNSEHMVAEIKINSLLSDRRFKPYESFLGELERPSNMDVKIEDRVIEPTGNFTLFDQLEFEQKAGVKNISVTNLESNENEFRYSTFVAVSSKSRDEEIRSIPVDKIDLVVYQSLDIDLDNSTCIFDESEIDKEQKGNPSSFESLKALRKTNRSLKMIASLGGWNNSLRFYDFIFIKNGNLNLLAKNCFKLIYDKDIFDGIDLNIKFPCPKGEKCREDLTKTGENDSYNYTALVKAFRQAMGSSYILSITTSASKSIARQYQFEYINPLVNFIIVETYQLRSRKTGFSGVTEATYSTQDAIYSVDSTIDYYINILKATSRNLIVSVTFRGTGFKLKGSCDYLLSSKCNADREKEAKLTDNELNYDILNENFVKQNSYVLEKNSKGAFVVDEDNFYSFNVPETIVSKLKVVKERNLGGIMSFFTNDDSKNFDLLKAMTSKK